MRHLITFESYSISRNAGGEEIKTWATLVTDRAEILHQAGGSTELDRADRQTARTSITMRLRYRETITERMRVRWSSKVWNIRSILPDNHLRYMTLELEHFYT